MIDLDMPRGKQFELGVLGVTGEKESTRPQYYDYEESLNQVIKMNWANFERSKTGELEWHDPVNPSMGMTAQIWNAVQRNLLVFLEEPNEPNPLNFYVSVGYNSLDYYHGVDAFFWWYGVVATIDLSLINKNREGKCKADFLLMPHDLQGESLALFGQHIALFLEREFLTKKIREIEKKRHALHHLSDYLHQ